MDTYGANGENNSTAWFVGIIIALALVAIAYLAFTPRPENIDPVLRDVFVDPETGCEYLRGYGYYPRYGVDGKQICRQQNEAGL